MDILSQALQAIRNAVNPAAQYAHMQSPIVERDDMQKDPALQYYYAHQPDNKPSVVQSALKQVTSQAQASGNIPKDAFSGFTTAKVPNTLAPLIYTSAQKAGVDPNVFASLLFSEHGFQTSAGINKNTDGSYDRGIAQINTAAHPEITDEQALNPQFAVPYAANLLASHIKNMQGNYARGIAAYNVGEGGASLQGDTPSGLGPRGQAYLDKVGKGLSPQLQQKLGIKTNQ